VATKRLPGRPIRPARPPQARRKIDGRTTSGSGQKPRKQVRSRAGKDLAGEDVLLCRPYWIFAWDPRTDYTTVCLAYVGETSYQDHAYEGEGIVKRHAEHMTDKPWADTVEYPDGREALANGWLVYDPTYVYTNKTAVWDAEKSIVERDKPLYNVEWNRHRSYPGRIEPWRALQQRHARDRLAGRPLWVDPKRKSMVVPPTWLAGAAETIRSTISPRWNQLSLRRRVFLRVAGWTVATALLWLAVAKVLPGLTGAYPSWRMPSMLGALVAQLLLYATRPPRTGPRWIRVRNGAGQLVMVVVLLRIGVDPILVWITGS
jgi:hypothetical protein